ncbi:TonB-dependent siderophore receptor [Microbulbifer sp. YPW1]|uniref:TonB-dependent receptor plug domain-containing protein n=1 Tax=Microbulbifer sp. YPW1 TaxID=2745199 RepID=UPI0015979F0A|nr:TonB-dependent receptor [Microbulbifer sp. YPW1]QKX18228.1 TonB-dependent receptor [Microbulbifer sp. YPW1]
MQTSKKLLAIAIAATASHSALSQSATNDNADSNVGDAALVEELVVTGSRIQRSTFDTPSPTSVIDKEAIQMTGELNLNEVLSTMPQFGSGYDATSGSYSFGNSGLNALDMRDLGVKRTLSLVNGHRPVQITSDNNTMVTEIGMIPAELVERIEVLTGGASAVYGADAVAGVVNFILKDNYEGVSVRTQLGTTEEGGADNGSLTFTFGENFADNRGNFALSLDYFEQKPLYYRDRESAAGRTRYIPNPENTGPEDGIPDFIIHNNITYPDFNITGNAFGVWNPEYGESDWYQLNGDQAQLRTPASALSQGWMATDGSGYDPNAYNFARSPFERLNGYSRVTYDLTDTTRFSADLMYSKTESYDEIDPDFIWGTWTTVEDLESNGIAIPTGVQQVLSDYGDNWLLLPYTFSNAGPRWHTTEREYVAVSATLEGEFKNGWKWDTYFNTGMTDSQLTQGNSLRYDRLDSSNFTLIGPCVEDGTCPDFSPFTPSSDAVHDYVMATHTTNTDVEQHAFAANLTGDLLELPAGFAKFGAGFESRYESLDYQPSELWKSGVLSSQQTAIDDVSRTVHEAYGELLVPLLADLPLMQSLEFEAAVRGAEYSTEAANFTSWKTGLNWAINDSLRFRTVYSKAVRAPQLGEMYLGTSIGYTDLTDPCDADEIDGGPADGRRAANCAALGIDAGWDSNLKGQRGRVISEGNQDLKEEDATTFTAGFVFTPSSIDGLNISIDYYDIDLTDMIVRFGASNTLALCVDSESVNNDFCTQVVRAASGDVESVRDTYINADGSRRTGVDIEADYQFSLVDAFNLPGDMRFNLVTTRQLESSYSATNNLTGELETTDYLGEFGVPKWKADLRTSYYLNDLSVSLTTKFTQGGPIDLDGRAERYESSEVKDSLYFNLWAGYQIVESTQLYLGVNNLSDERWTDHPYTSYGSANYSLLGRTLYAGAQLKF